MVNIDEADGHADSTLVLSNLLHAILYCITVGIAKSDRLLASQPSAQAGDLYWDTNADVAGSGNAGGAWDTGTPWSTDAAGTVATVGWINGENAIFSAGTDGVAGKTVTLGGTVATPLIRLEEAGIVTLNGGTLDVTGGTTFDTSVLGAGGGGSLNWTPAIIGNGDLTLKVNGDISDTGGGSNTVFVLSGANTFTGNVRFTSGVTRLSSGFGNAANKLILDGGGFIDDNLNITTARNIEIGAGGGIIRLWGGATTNLNGTFSNEAGVLSATVKRTDGGTLRLNGSGAGFTGTFINARGNLYFVSKDWSGTDLVTTDGGNVVYFPTAGDTTIKSLTSDRDLNIAAGARLNIATGVYNAVSPPTTNNFWMQGAGKLTSSSNTLTFNWGTSYLVAGDQSVRVIVEDYAPGVPLAVVKNGPGGLNNYDKANTYTGGTTINGGRIAASNVGSFGTGTVTVNAGGQAYITAGGTYAHGDFICEGWVLVAVRESILG